VPEGDTIHKIANYLAPRLESLPVDRLEIADRDAARRIEGRRITSVSASGKHLFIAFDDDTALRSHLGMYGAWHRYAPGERWNKPRRRASVVLEAGGDTYVCFNAKEIEVVRSPSVRERIVATRLGPDLVASGVDTAAVVARAREFANEDTLVADTLLDQRVAAGIGNVYKSEVLFINRRLPATRLTDVDDAELAEHYSLAADLLRRNLGGGRRVTRFETDSAGRLWAYGRRGLPCLRCEGRISSACLGRHHRGTYWCAGCQS